MSWRRALTRRARRRAADRARREERKRREAFRLEALEPRLLLSADPVLLHAATAASDLHLDVQNISGVDHAVLTDDTGSEIASAELSAVDTQGVLIVGSDDDDTLTIGDSAHVIDGGVVFDAGAGDDTLAGPSQDSTWRVTGDGAGEVNDGDVRFEGVETLLGATDNEDTFVIAPGGVIDLVDGNDGGFDILEVEDGGYSHITSTATGPQSGFVEFDGETVVYDGLEPVAVPAGNTITFNLAGTNDVLNIRPDGADFIIEVTSGTAESTTFSVVAATTAVNVNLGGGNDQVTLTDLEGTNLDGILTIDGQGGNDTYRFDDSWGAGVTIVEAGGGGLDTLDFGPFGGSIIVDANSTTDLDVTGSDGSSVEFDPTNFEGLVGANVDLVGTATAAFSGTTAADDVEQLKNRLVGGLEQVKQFADIVGAVGGLASGLPLIGSGISQGADSTVGVALSKALDFVESFDELRLEVENFFDPSAPALTTDLLLDALNLDFNGASPRTLEHLGAAALSQLPSGLPNPLTPTESFTFRLTVDTNAPVDISFTTQDIIDTGDFSFAGIVEVLNVQLALEETLAGVVQAVERQGRLAFQAVGAELQNLAVEGVGASVETLGFADGVPIAIDQIQETLRGLGDLQLGFGNAASFSGSFEGGVPQLRLNVDYEAARQTGFSWDLGPNAQGSGISVDVSAEIEATASLFADLELGLSLDPTDIDFFLDVNALRAGITAGFTNAAVGLQIGFIDVDGTATLNLDAGVALDTSGLQGVTDPSAISVGVSDLTLTNSAGTAAPSFSLDIGVSIGAGFDPAFGPSASILASGDPFDGSSITFAFTGDIGDFFSFNNLSAAGVISAIAQLRSLLEGITNSDLLDSISLPFVEGGLDRVLDFAEIVSDTLLFDDGLDGVRDGADRIVTDINQALTSAGLGEVLRAEGDGLNFVLKVVDPDVSGFTLETATGDAGGVADLGLTDTVGEVLSLTGGGAALLANLGVIGGSAKFNVRLFRGGVADDESVEVELDKILTDDNMGIGDDIAKLVDAFEAPTFDTAQEFSNRLIELFGIDGLGFDAAGKILTYEVSFQDVELLDLELPTDFEFNLGEIASVSSDTRLIVKASGGLGFTLGFDLSDNPPGSSVLIPDDLGTPGDDESTPLADLGVEIKLNDAVAAPDGPAEVFLGLSQEAVFQIKVGNGAQTELTVPASGPNPTIAGLVSDINDLINSSLVLDSGEIQARADNGVLQLVVIDAAVDSLELDVDTTNAAFTQLGIQPGFRVERADPTEEFGFEAASPLPRAIGQLSADAVFTIDLESGASSAVTVLQADTVSATNDAFSNRSILDLRLDVQKAVDAALGADVVEVGTSSGRLLFTRVDSETLGFTITSGANAGELGLSGTLASSDDDLLITFEASGVSPVGLALDGAETIDDVLTLLNGVPNLDAFLSVDDPETPIDETDTGITLRDTSVGDAPDRQFMVEGVNGSLAGLQLGIVGVDANTAVDSAATEDGLIEGASLAGATLLDRFFLTGDVTPTGFSADSLANMINAEIEIGAGRVVEDLRIVGTNRVQSSSFTFSDDDVGKVLAVKGTNGFVAGDYTIASVNTVDNEATLTPPGADIGPLGLAGGVGILRDGVAAEASLGFVGITLDGSASLGASLGLGFDTSAAAFADERLTVQEVLDGLSDVLSLLSPPEISLITGDPGITNRLELTVGLETGSADFGALASTLLGTDPSLTIDVLTLGDPFIGTRFERAGYTQTSATTFTVDEDFSARLPAGADLRVSQGATATTVEIVSAVFSAGTTTVTVLPPPEATGFALPTAAELTAGDADFILLPSVDVDLTGLDGELPNFSDLSFADIVAALRALVDFLGEFESFDFLSDTKLPVIDKSISDLLGYAQDLGDAVDQAQRDPAGTLQFLETKINEAIGLGGDRLDDLFTIVDQPVLPGLTDDVLDLTLDGDVLKFDFSLGTSFSEGLDVAIQDLPFGDVFEELGLDDVLDLSGSANLQAEGGVLFRLTLGIDVTNFDISNPTNSLLIYDTTGLDAALRVAGEDLAFRIGVGPFALSIAGTEEDPSEIEITADAALDLNSTIFTDGKVSLDTVLGNLSTVITGDSLQLTGTIDGQLPVYFPNDSTRIGAIEIGGSDAAGDPTPEGNLANLLSSPLPFLQTAEGETLPADQVVIDVSDIIAGLDPSNFDFSNFSLFDNIFLAVDGIDSILGLLSDVIGGQIGGFSLPLIGDSLSEGAGFIDDFREDFVAPFREAIETAKDTGQDFADPDLNIISGLLFDLVGPDGLNLLKPLSAGGTPDSPDDFIGLDADTLVDFLIDPNTLPENTELQDTEIVWNFKLGSPTPLTLGTDIDFDLGIPGLGLQTDGAIELVLDWELNLGLGLSFQDGFFLVIDSENELLFDFQVNVPGMISGQLGFLGLDAVASADTGLGATFRVNLFEEGATGADAERLGFTEFGSIGIDAGLAASAKADLALTLGLNPDLIPGGGGSGFPEVVADFIFLWELGSRDLNATTLADRAAASTFLSFDSISGSAITDGLQAIGFQNVELDVGTFLSDVIGPILDEVSRFTEPLQPLVDFVTSPIPIVGQLGLDITWLDLAGALGDFDPSFIESVAEIITFINDISAASSESGVMLTIGNFPLFDPNGLIGPAPTLPSFNFDPTEPGLGSGSGSTRDAFGSLASQLDLDAALGDLESALANSGSGGTMTGQTASNLARGDSSFALPFLEDPSQIFGLLLGNPIDLVTYDLGALSFEFGFSQFFTIFGPLGVSIGLDVNFLADTAFGYDTTGIQRFVETDFRNPGVLFDGFFISDSPKLDGVDDPELVFGAELTAAAELNLGVASAGVAAALGFNIFFDLFDPNDDLKIRFSELAANFENELNFGSPALAPLAIFDISGEIFARLFAFLKINLAFVSFEKEFPIFGPVTLLDFEVPFTRPPVLAEVPDGGGELVLNAGAFASQRLNGDVNDSGETFVVTHLGGGEIMVEAPDLFGDAITYEEVSGKIVAVLGDGDDHITFRNFGGTDFDFDIDLGSGNDTLIFDGPIPSPSTGSALIRGGAGDDNITASSGSDIIIGGAGDDTIRGEGGRDLIFGDEGELGEDRVSAQARANDGRDMIFGGDGDDLAFGGGGVDTIEGEADNDLLLGGGGTVLLTAAPAAFAPVPTSRNLSHDPTQDSPVDDVQNLALDGAAGDTLRGGQGTDIIFGTGGPDTIEGGSEDDTIFGFAGRDDIQGNEGDDTIFGDGGAIQPDRNGDPEGRPFAGGDPDTIDGGEGADTIFGGGGGDFIEGGPNGPEVDRIFGGSGPDIIFGDNGSIVGTTPTPTTPGPGDGDDIIFGQGEPDLIFGGGGNDVLDGGAGPDIVRGGGGNDTLIGNKGNDLLNGEEDSDTVRVEVQGASNASARIRAVDSGSNGVDLLVVDGTAFDDQFLLRANTSKTISFVALINDGRAERVDYDGFERGIVNAGGGDDAFAVDDVDAEFTLNGGRGEDTFQFAQLFRDERITPDIFEFPLRSDGSPRDPWLDVGDSFATIETTRGFLSNGITQPLTANGGLGDDRFVVFHNLAVLSLNGESGDDFFEVRAFALAGSQEPQQERTDITGGAGADLILYAVNAPVNINGGDGLDTLSVIGTEFGDDFVITKDGVFGAGLTINFVNIEVLRVDGAEGDDRFFVDSTSEKFVTEILGGLGSDTFNLSGDTPPVVSNDLRGHSGLILHEDVESIDPRYNGQQVLGVSANVADDEEPFVVVSETDGSTIVTESSLVIDVAALTAAGLAVIDSYTVVLTRAPTSDVRVIAGAPFPTPNERERHALKFRLDSPTGVAEDNGTAVTLTFTPTDWSVPQTVYVLADATELTDTAGILTRPELQGEDTNPLIQGIDFTMDDSAVEGLHFGIINHTVQADLVALTGTFEAVTNGTNAVATITDPGLAEPNSLNGRRLSVISGPGEGTTAVILSVTVGGSGELLLDLDQPLIGLEAPVTTAGGSVYEISTADDPLSVTVENLDLGSPATVQINASGSFAGLLTGRVISVISGDGLGQAQSIVGVTSLGGTVLELTLAGNFLTGDVPTSGLGGSEYLLTVTDSLAGTMTAFDEDPTGLPPLPNVDPEDDRRSTFTDADASFPVDELRGAVLEIVGGAGLGQQRLILGNDATTLILNGPWSTNPVPGESVYSIKRNAGLAVPSVTVEINDNDRPGIIVDETLALVNGALVDDIDTITSVIEGGDGDQRGERDVLAIQLTNQPSSTVTVGLVFDASQFLLTDLAGTPITSLDFDNAGVVEHVVVQALADGVREGFHSGLIEFDISGPVGDPTAAGNDVFLSEDRNGDLVTSVGLEHVPNDGSVSLTLDDDALPDGVSFEIRGNEVIFVNEVGDLVEIDGDIAVTYTYAIPGYINASAPPVLTRIGDAEAPGILLRETGGSTDVVEGRSETDSYELVLTGVPTGDVTFLVSPEITKTSRTGGIRTDEIQVTVSSADARAVAQPNGDLLVTFGVGDWDVPLVVDVAPIDDAVLDGGDTKEFAPGPNTLDRILGPVTIDGAGGSGSLALPPPVILPGETNLRKTDGTAIAFTPNTTDGFGAEEILTVETEVLENKVLALGLDDNGAVDLDSLLGRTIEVSRGPGLEANWDPNRTFGTVTAFDENPGGLPPAADPTTDERSTITDAAASFPTAGNGLRGAVVSIIDGPGAGQSRTIVGNHPDDPTHRLILNGPWRVDPVPGESQYRIERPDLIYDRFWRIVGIEDQLDGTSLLTLKNPSQVNPATFLPGEIPDATTQYAITNLSGNFFALESDQVDTLFVHDEDSPADHEGFLTANRLSGLNMGPDLEIGGRLRPGGVSYGNLEVVEIDLGTGNNDFTVFGTHSRADGFATWTFLNTGDDIEFGGVQGDTVTVDISAEDELTSTGNVTAFQNADPLTGIIEPLITIEGTYADGELAGQVITIVGAGTGDAGAVAQERRVLDNTGNVLWVDNLLDVDPTGTVYELVKQADGAFAINTQGGDDTVDASASTRGITIFGGLGDDNITGGSGEDLIFGDRGRVDYRNDDGLVVTRLGFVRDDTLGDEVGATAGTPNLGMVATAGNDFAGTVGGDPDPFLTVVGGGLPTGDGSLAGTIINIINGQGAPQAGDEDNVARRMIVGNTADTIFIDADWSDGRIPDNTSEYRISYIPEDQTDATSRGLTYAASRDPGNGGVDTINGGGGNDLIIGGAAGDILDGGADDDILFGDHAKHDPDELDYPEPLGQLRDTQNVISIFTDVALGGDDEIRGGAGDDRIFGQQGGDTIFGDAGEDDIIGGHNIVGAPDTGDEIHGGADADFVFGDNGVIDRILQADGSFARYAGLFTGGGIQFNHLLRDAVPFDDIDEIAGDDMIFGDGGDDTLHGQRGDDTVEGGDDDDEVFGELGSDTLRGGAGNDILLADVGHIIRALDLDGRPLLNENGSWHRDVVLEELAHAGGFIDLDQTPLRVDDPDLADKLLKTDLLIAGGNFTGTSRHLTTDTNVWDTELLLLDLFDPDNDVLEGDDGDDILFGQRGDDILRGGADDDLLIGDGASNLTPYETQLPKVWNEIRILDEVAGAPTPIAIEAGGFGIDHGIRRGTVISPPVRIEPEVLDLNAPFVLPDPFGTAAPSATNEFLSLTGADWLARTDDTSLSFRPYASIIPDVANHAEELRGNDTLEGDGGDDWVIGDDLTTYSPLVSGLNQVEDTLTDVWDVVNAVMWGLDTLGIDVNHAENEIVQGAVASATANTVTVSGVTLPTTGGGLAGAWLNIIDGTGARDGSDPDDFGKHLIASNTADTITLFSPFDAGEMPDATSYFVVVDAPEDHRIGSDTIRAGSGADLVVGDDALVAAGLELGLEVDEADFLTAASLLHQFLLDFWHVAVDLEHVIFEAHYQLLDSELTDAVAEGRPTLSDSEQVDRRPDYDTVSVGNDAIDAEGGDDLVIGDQATLVIHEVGAQTGAEAAGLPNSVETNSPFAAQTWVDVKVALANNANDARDALEDHVDDHHDVDNRFLSASALERLTFDFAFELTLGGDDISGGDNQDLIIGDFGVVAMLIEAQTPAAADEAALVAGVQDILREIEEDFIEREYLRQLQDDPQNRHALDEHRHFDTRGGFDNKVAVAAGSDLISGDDGDDSILGDSVAIALTFVGDDPTSRFLPAGAGTVFEAFDVDDVERRTDEFGGRFDVTGIDSQVNEDTIFGNAGNDLILGQQGTDTIQGGTDDDTVFGGTGAGQAATVFGGDGAFNDPGDVVTTTSGNEPTVADLPGLRDLLFAGVARFGQELANDILTDVPSQRSVDAFGATALPDLRASEWNAVVADFTPANRALADFDGDGIPNTADNLLLIANPTQLDTDGDGIGNQGDADFNNDGVVTIFDFILFRNDFITRVDSGVGTDMNGDGVITIFDFVLFLDGFAERVPAATGLPLHLPHGRTELQRASDGVAMDSSAADLRTDELAPVVDEAIRRWSIAFPEAEETLSAVDVRITALPGGALGRQVGDTVLIDTNAAGHGWFIDPTPSDDSEFIEGDAPDAMDLLTTVMHEFGHVLGVEDPSAHPVMSEFLNPGTRLTVEAAPRGDDVRIAHNAIVADSVEIGDRVRVGPRVEIGDDGSVGSDTKIARGAKIGARARIGADVTIERDAVIPADSVVLTGTTVASPNPSAMQEAWQKGDLAGRIRNLFAANWDDDKDRLH